MGISGLLPLLKSIQTPCSLKKFVGQTVGVDAYGWLHRGAAACAIQLASGEPTRKYVDSFMFRVRMLIHFGITPYLVFDGDYLPSKAGTEKERATRREESRKLGLELLRLGKTSQAYQELQKSVDVTPEMARVLIEELKKDKVQYVVAPYEADSQLAYLERSGVIQAIISEDSDLLVFGARCLLTKLDQHGECLMIRRDNFTACREVSLVGWSDREFRRMAILSGCDYLDNINKMGLKTAYRLLRKHKTVERLLQAVQFDGSMKVPPGYLADFIRAETTFLYQWVFCPKEQRLVNLTKAEPGVKIDEMSYIGQYVEPDIAAAVARGDLHPHTKEPIKPPNRASTCSSGRSQAQENLQIKKNKSIESFFKPNRVPLAELDPNSFVLTPRQSEMRSRASGTSWSSPLLPRSAGSASSPRDPSLTARRSTSDSWIGTRTNVQPNKRQRLCDDGSSASPSMPNPGSAETGRSKFFVKKAKSKRTRGSADFDIFSDDSIEDALRNLPDPKLSPKPQTGAEFPCKPAETLLDELDSQKTLVDDDDDVDDDVSSSKLPRRPTLTSSESTLIDTPSQTNQPRFDKFLIEDIKSLRDQTNLERSMSEKGNSTVINPPKLFTAAQAKSSLRKLSPGFDNKNTIVSATAAAEEEEEEEEEIVVPASDASEEAETLKSVESLVEVKGSEDLIISESEVDDEVESPKKTKLLDLKRFAFVPLQ